MHRKLSMVCFQVLFRHRYCPTCWVANAVSKTLAHLKKRQGKHVISMEQPWINRNHTMTHWLLSAALAVWQQNGNINKEEINEHVFSDTDTAMLQVILPLHAISAAERRPVFTAGSRLHEDVGSGVWQPQPHQAPTHQHGGGQQDGDGFGDAHEWPENQVPKHCCKLTQRITESESSCPTTHNERRWESYPVFGRK